MRSTTAILLAGFLLAGCAAGSPERTPPATEAGQRPALEGMRGIMTEKLVHTHALLEAISLQHFARIERHADALTEISLRSDWEVHSTMAYEVFSEQFRGVTRDLAAHARAEDDAAISSDYVRLVQSCLECHGYLRREGLIDTPGRVTMQPAAPAGG
jgi:hypothetical protein